jgi:hypothetical protein
MSVQGMYDSPLFLTLELVLLLHVMSFLEFRRALRLIPLLPGRDRRKPHVDRIVVLFRVAPVAPMHLDGQGRFINGHPGE